MQLSRQVASLLLVGVLVSGGLLAPVTHLVYMEVSSAYAPMHAGSHETRHAPVDEPYLQVAHEAHPACPYLALFATPLIGDLAQPLRSPTGDHSQAPLLEPSVVQWYSTLLYYHPVRGPPCDA